jgi:hypothetical protein
MARTDVFQTYWLNAGMIKNGGAQTFIVQQAVQNRILQSTHVVRDKDGDDVLLMIFVDEQHAKTYGIPPATPAPATPGKPYTGF